MTITEQLQFSVLTAPVAALDRRTLSQAWYSALYAHASRGDAAAKPRLQAAQIPPQARAVPNGDLGRVPAPRSANARVHGAKGLVHAEGAPLERRAPRSPLARRIERTFLHPSPASRKASFTVENEQGRVHVLLQARGNQFKLVAICSPKARAQVAAALAQARYALALRGIDLDADTRGAVPC